MIHLPVSIQRTHTHRDAVILARGTGAWVDTYRTTLTALLSAALTDRSPLPAAFTTESGLFHEGDLTACADGTLTFADGTSLDITRVMTAIIN